MNKNQLITILIILACNIATAQQRLSSIKGLVVDSISGKQLHKASISLSSDKAKKAIRNTISKDSGFALREIPTGEYIIIISHTGYTSDTIILNITTDSSYDMGIIALTPAADMLMEVVVRATIPPVLVRNDTLVFNPNAVRTQPNATVEDLLKKLPGIQVDKDGDVSINGRKVEKIYIDGKEFILGDPRTATQNLTADMIEVVEAFDHQSKRARFTGIRENTNTKAINLKIKKNKRNTLLFNTTAGVGTGKTITGRINATTFRSDYWLVGNADFNAVDTRTKNNGIFERSANQDVNWKSSIAPNIDVTLNARLGQSRSSSSQMQTKETFLGDSSLLQETTSGNASTGTTATATAQATWAIDTFNTIVYGLTVNNSRTTSRNGQATSVYAKDHNGMRGLTLGNTDNTITASQLNLSNSLNWQHRFKKAGRTLFADFSFGTTRQNEDGKLLSLVDFTNTTADQVTDQQYLQTGRGHTVSVHATYTEPVAKHQIVSLSYNVSYANNQLQKNAFNLNDATGKYEMPDSTNSNELDNENSLHKIAVGYNYNGGRLKYQSGASLSYGELKTNSRGIVPRNATQYNLNWAPSVGVNYQVSRRQNIGIQYSGANQMPGADMLQPLPDISNPFIIRVGNPNLRQQFSHNASMNYALYNDKTFNTFLVSLSGSATTNKLTQASLITSGGIQQLQYINVNGVYNVGGNVAYTYSINKGRSGALSAAAYIQHSRDISFVNGVKNVYTGITITQSVNLNYHLAELLYVNVNANLSAANGRYAIGSDLNTKNVSQAYDADVTYRLPWQLYLNSSFRINRIGSQRNFAAQSVSTLNASIFKTMMKNRGELRLDAFDLLNQNTGISRVIGNNYVETSESNVLQRYFLLTFKYRFSIASRTK